MTSRQPRSEWSNSAKLLIGAALLPVAFALTAEGQTASVADRYRNAVDSFMRCEDTRVHAVLNDLSSSQLLEAASAFRTAVASHAEILAAAALMHMSHARGIADEDLRDMHNELTGRYLRSAVAAHLPRSKGALAVSLMISALESEGEVGQAVELLAGMPADHRSEGLVQLAIGSTYDLLSTPLVSLSREDVSHFRPVDRWGKRLIEAARGDRPSLRAAATHWYRQAIESTPTDPEAYIRLALLLTEEGHGSDALELLEVTAELRVPPVLSYFRSLVRARIARLQMQLRSSFEAYEQAARLAPNAQAPILGGAAVLVAEGREQDARDFYLANASRFQGGRATDPWWIYPFGQTWRSEELASRLDSQVRRCRP